nr:hypothetical protein HK105_005198 [Polyrhizophydium stewartii]
MGRRMNPLALRLKNQLSWPSNVYHPMLKDYIRHVFQHSITGTPGIRASTTGVWVNVTLFAADGKHPLDHPLVKEPTLDFKSAEVLQAPGRLEKRTAGRAARHSTYKPVFAQISPKSIAEALGGATNANQALHIHHNKPINLKINIISNPLLNAEVLAQYVARSMNNGKQLATIQRSLLQRLG